MVVEWSDDCEQSFDHVIRQAEIRIKEDYPDRDYVIETFTDKQKLFLFTVLISQMKELIDNERSDWSRSELSDIEGLFNNLQESSDPYSPDSDDALFDNLPMADFSN